MFISSISRGRSRRERAGHSDVAWPLCLVAALALASPAESVSPSGAKGFAWYHTNPGYSWMPAAVPLGSGLPGYTCHVLRVVDGSLPWGDGGAQAQGAAGWIELAPCMNLAQNTTVRVNSWSTLVVEDPLEDASAADQRGSVLEAGGACDCELSPGAKVWGRGPDDPTMPADRVGTPVAETYADLSMSPGPFELVIDYERDTGVTRITNSPHSLGPIVARAKIGPAPDPIHLLPGESIRYSPTGEIAGPGTVMVRALGSVVGQPGHPTVLEFEVWNLSGAIVNYAIEVEDSQGWTPEPLVSTMTVSPFSMELAAVSLAIPDTAMGYVEGIELSAIDLGDPRQFHSDLAYVTVEDVTGVADLASPGRPYLAEPRPNPVSRGTEVSFWLPERSTVEVVIFDARGRRVVDLTGRYLRTTEWCAGWHTIAWDATDDRRRPVASGAYFVRLRGATFMETRRVTVVR